MNSKNLSQLFSLLKEIKFSRVKIILFITIYYFTTFVTAILDSVGIMMLVSIFTLEFFSFSNLINSFPIAKGFFENVTFQLEMKDMILVLIVIFSLNFSIKFSLLTFNGWLIANLRRKLQEKIFNLYLNTEWNSMKDYPIGKALGTCTYETLGVVGYTRSLIDCGYFFLTALVFSIIPKNKL